MNIRRLTAAAAAAAAAVVVATLVPPAPAADWPAFRGPNHDGISAETVAWPKAVKPVFKVPVGEGFGTMAVSGNKIFLTAEGGGQEALLALDAATGQSKWHHVLGRSIYEGQGGNGPRTTPATDGKLVVAYSTHLNLVACDAETGKPLWQHDVQAAFGGKSQMTGGIQKWGNASSPVIDGDRVYVFGGGAGNTFLAFEKATGKLAWKAGDEKITHASPTVATIHGVRQVIFFCQSGLVSVDAASGNELWKFPHKYNVSTASTPVVGGKDGDVVYCSAGYKVGAAAARIAKDSDKFTATALWRNTDEHELANHWTSCVHKDGYLYGIFGFKQYGQAPLKCVNVESGKVMWEKPGFGPGGTILAGDTVVATGDKGQVAFVRATPEGYHATGGANLVEGKVWNAAIVANGKLYVRSTKQNGNSKEQGWLVCLDVAGGK